MSRFRFLGLFVGLAIGLAVGGVFRAGPASADSNSGGSATVVPAAALPTHGQTVTLSGSAVTVTIPLKRPAWISCSAATNFVGVRVYPDGGTSLLPDGGQDAAFSTDVQLPAGQLVHPQAVAGQGGVSLLAASGTCTVAVDAQ